VWKPALLSSFFLVYLQSTLVSGTSSVVSLDPLSIVPAVSRLHDALLTRLSNDDDPERNLSTFSNEMASSAMILSEYYYYLFSKNVCTRFPRYGHPEIDGSH
jgi:hypothetical protein